MTTAEYYWEEGGTPKNQRLISLNWQTLAPLFVDDEREYEVIQKDLDLEFEQRVVHELVRQNRLPRVEIAKVLRILSKSDAGLIGNWEHAVARSVGTILGPSTRLVRGVYNQFLAVTITKKLEKFKTIVSDGLAPDELILFNSTVDEAIALCSKDRWRDVCELLASQWQKMQNSLKHNAEGSAPNFSSNHTSKLMKHRLIKHEHSE